jgi:hypothetical protein
VHNKTGEASTKNKSVEERIEGMATRAGGLPGCLDHDALAEFMRAAERLMKDTIGEEGDRHMWSGYLLILPGFLLS